MSLKIQQLTEHEKAKERLMQDHDADFQIHLTYQFFASQINALRCVLGYEFYFILRTARTTSVVLFGI